MNTKLLDTPPEELATKYDVYVRTMKNWIKDSLPLRVSRDNTFFENPSLLKEPNNSLSAEYDVHVTTISKWKRDFNNHCLPIVLTSIMIAMLT